MKSNLGIWGALTKLIFVLLVLAGLLAVGVWYLPLIQQNERLRKEILRLNQDIQKEDELARHLKAEINSLQRNPKAVERLARERLGYARPNETVIRFEPAPTNSVRSRP